MGWFKQLCLSWIILSAATAYVLCQELTSTVREGNRTCPGEEVIFNCTVRGPSTLAVLNLAWSSPEYISRSLQLSTTNRLGAEETSTDMDGVITATATVTNIANVTGELTLKSTLRIIAVEASTVTCMSGADGGTASIEFLISVIPGVPQRIDAAEISRPRDNICIILVTWDPPANSDESDIDRYIVYVPSRNIGEVSSSTISTLTVTNCGDDIHVRVAAMNRVGCVGQNSSKVQLTLLDIPTSRTRSEPATTEGRSTPTSSQLGVGGVVGITVLSVALAVMILCFTGIGFAYYVYYHLKIKGHTKQEKESYPLVDLYYALRSQSRKKTKKGKSEEASNSFIMSTLGALRLFLKTAEDISDSVVTSLMILMDEEPDDMQKALDYLMKIIPDMSCIDNGFKSNIEKLRKEASERNLLEIALDNMINKVLDIPPKEIQEILLSLCDALFEKFLNLSSDEEEALKKFDIPLESLREVEELLTGEFRGAESEEGDANVKMFDTYIHKMPEGTEKGEFLIVDLGINHLRILHINTFKGRIKKQNCKIFSLEETIATNSSYENLFDFIVDCIAKFIEDQKIRKKLPITFAFPFPMKHESLTSGKLIRWTRGFKATGGEGKDIVQLLKDAASRRVGDTDIEINVVALINDATGILLAMGNKVSDCRIGLALSDGANACYMEELDTGDCKVINTEWGAFGDDGKLEQWRTDYDRDLDDTSRYPNQQVFEKMISDRYQGVVIYRVLKDLISKKALFKRVTSPKLDRFEAISRGRFNLGIIEGWDMEKCKKLIKDCFNIKASDNDCEVIRRVCVAVSTRAARLAAAGIVALVKKIKKTDGCTVAVDASLYELHPQFPKRIQVELDELEPMSNIKMESIKDGSRLGAAFAAAMNYGGPWPPPSLSPRSPVSVGFEGQGEQQELISADVEVHTHHGGDIELGSLA